MEKQEVILILNDYEGDVAELSKNKHVWINKSKRDLEKTTNLYSQGSGITVFNGLESEIETFYDMLPTIIEHHSGDGSKYDCWNKITVIGLNLDKINMEQVKQSLDDEITFIKINNDCFVLERRS